MNRILETAQLVLGTAFVVCIFMGVLAFFPALSSDGQGVSLDKIALVFAVGAVFGVLYLGLKTGKLL